MIIKGSHFVGDIYLPQVGAGASSIVNNNDLIDKYILEYEPKILKKGLGRGLYKEFNENLQSDGSLIAEADQKWEHLLNGTEYTKGDITYFWRGIVEDHGTYYKSFIAYYIFYWYVKEENIKRTTLGTVKPSAENAEIASPNPKLTAAWRKFYEWYYGATSNQNPNIYMHKGHLVEDYFTGSNNSKDVSLFQFLSDNRDIYPNWSFTRVENKTSWGI